MTVAALARRDFLLARSYRTAFVLDAGWGVANLLLYYFISRVVGLHAAAHLGQAPSYFAFALAGVLMSLVVEAAASEIGGAIREEQLTGTLEMLLAQPVRAVSLALGSAAFPFASAVVRVSVYLVVAVFALGLDTQRTDWVGIAVLLAMGGLAFSAFGVAAAAAVIVFKKSALVDAAIFGMTFLSGALFPISVFPRWLRPVGQLMPTKPAFDGMRNALYGGGWGTDALVLAAIGTVGIPVSLVLFNWAIRHAKRRGTVSQY